MTLQEKEEAIQQQSHRKLSSLKIFPSTFCASFISIKIYLLDISHNLWHFVSPKPVTEWNVEKCMQIDEREKEKKMFVILHKLKKKLQSEREQESNK